MQNYFGIKLLNYLYYTLLVQDFRQQKNQPLPIQPSRPSGYSQEPKTAKKIQFSRWLFQKIPFLYFFLHKSWIWWTLGHVINIFSYWHYHDASKEYFWSNFFQISCTSSKVPFWQFFNFSKNPGYMQEKVQKGDFLKKPSRELKFFCCFRFL